VRGLRSKLSTVGSPSIVRMKDDRIENEARKLYYKLAERVKT